MYGTGISQEVGNGGQVCGDVEAVDFTVQNVYKTSIAIRLFLKPVDYLIFHMLRYQF